MIAALLFVLLLAAGAGLAYVMGAGAVLAYVASGNGAFLAALPQRIFSSVDVFAFMAIPLFVLVGELMNRGGITRALVDLAVALVGRRRGALGYVNVLAGLFFAGISGAAMADAAALSSTLVPAMRERGYKDTYAGAITAASAILGPIIPPSIILVFYGAIMNVDVAALLAAGVGPGALLAVMLMLANWYFARRYGHPGGLSEDRVPFWPALWRALPALSLPVVIVGGIVFGWMTPTEAAGIAVAAAVAVGYFYRTLDVSSVGESIVRATILSGSIFAIIIAASGIGFVATLTGLPAAISHLAIDLGLGLWGYMAALTVLFLIVGVFLDTQIGLALIAPIVVPVAIAQGANPVHIGVAICLNLSIGLLAPPAGGVLIVTATTAGIPYWRLVRATLPFLVIEIAALLLVVFVPEISLLIPRHFGLLHGGG
ncbi:MAG: TRAP transporter large permease [Rhizomicrobium sp.]